MPELGKYAFEVLLAYGVSLAILVALVAVSWARFRSVKARLARVEAQRNG